MSLENKNANVSRNSSGSTNGGINWKRVFLSFIDRWLFTIIWLGLLCLGALVVSIIGSFNHGVLTWQDKFLSQGPKGAQLFFSDVWHWLSIAFNLVVDAYIHLIKMLFNLLLHGHFRGR